MTTTAPAPTLDAPPVRRRSSAWWGMVLTIVTEAMIFAGLLSAYFFLRASSDAWPPAGIEPPELRLISVMSVVLIASSLPVVWAERAIRRGDRRRLQLWLAVAWVMGAAFLAHQGIEYRALTFGWGDNAYASAFYLITGLHGAHLLGALLMSVVVQAKAATGRFSADAHRTVVVFSLYWHFVDAVWVFVFASLYLSAHL